MGRLARRSVEGAARRRHPAAARRPRRRGRASRDGSARCSRERRSTSRSASRRCTRRCGRRAMRRSSCEGRDIIPDIRAAQSRMRTLSAQIRGGLRVGAAGRPIRAVVNLGIGGSDLGAFLVCSALAQPAARARQHRAADAGRRRLVRRQRRSGAPHSRAGAARSGDDVVRHHFEVVHDPGDARQCRQRQGVAAGRVGQGRGRQLAFHRGHRQRGRPRGRSAWRPRTSFRIWDWVGGRLLPLVACRAADRAQDRLGALSRSCWQARRASTRISGDRRSNATFRCSSGSRAGGTRRI